MHPKLIEANIALVKGERSEVQRLLMEYSQTVPEGQPDRDLALWLDAQSQHDHNERIRRLNILIVSVDPNSYYAQLARQILQEEEYYATLLNPSKSGARRTIFGMSLWKVAVFSAVGIGLVILMMGLLSPTNPPAADSDTASQSQQPTPLPDRSRALVADSFTARYEAGIIQITAVEDNSARVVDTRSNTLLQPVEGARFYALDVVFECRSGICENPPEATFAVRLEDGTLIENKPDAVIAGESTFEPIALGRTTTGWLIFQVPVISPVTDLLISPDSADNEEEPIVIPLESP